AGDLADRGLRAGQGQHPGRAAGGRPVRRHPRARERVSFALGALAAAPASSIDLDDPNSVSPGILGFLAFFLLAVALYLLVRNMNGHLRRVRYRQEALEAEEA